MHRSIVAACAIGCLVASLATADSALAQRGPRPGVTEADFVMRDFKFTDGSSLPELKIHYNTLGKPRKEADGKVHNAVLILHGTTGNGAGFIGAGFAGVLFGPGQDTDRADGGILRGTETPQGAHADGAFRG